MIVKTPAALKHGIGNPETETETETDTKWNTESVKEGSKRSIWKKKNYVSNDNKINKQIKKKTQMNKLAE